MTTDRLDLSARYSVQGYRGVAFYLTGWAQIWEPWMTLIEDEDGNEHEIETGEGEWIDDPDHARVIGVMVGDDREHELDLSDLTLISDDDYCHSCGQIGCTADGWPRDD